MPSSDIEIIESHENDVDPEIKDSSDDFGSHNIVTIPLPDTMDIKSYTPEKIRRDGGLVYSQIIKKDFIRENREASRFRLSDLVKGPLSVIVEEEARIESEVIKRVDARIEELSAKAVEESYAKGLAEGTKQGKEEVLAQAKPSLENFERLIKAIDGVKGDIFKANEAFFIHMICQIAKAVILKELKDDKNYIQRLIVHLLERLETKENFKVFLGETEYSSADQIKQGLAETLGQLKNISIEIDPKIKQGGCRIETEFGEVDARIEVQVENILKSMTST